MDPPPDALRAKDEANAKAARETNVEEEDVVVVGVETVVVGIVFPERATKAL